MEKLVKRRHQIVHEGDYNTRGKLRPVKTMPIVNKMKDANVFVVGAEELWLEAMQSRTKH